MFARHFIDSLDFAHNGGELRGVVPLAEMPRMHDILASADGEISFFVRGIPDKNGKPMLEVSVAGQCQLICQRCLKAFAHTVKLVSLLRLAQAGELNEFSADDNDDEMDSIIADRHLDVINMLEEEILLSLPFAPKHPVGACQPLVENLNNSATHPFATLEALKSVAGLKKN
jgi:uncharacterized protein